MTNNWASTDANSVKSAIGVSDLDGTTILPILINHTTGRVKLSAIIAGGMITSINGDTTAAQIITGGTGISVATVSGTTTITNTGSTSLTVGTTTISNGTTGRLLYDNGGTLGELDTATYPSLTELSYVKGVTSALQTQLNAKGAGTVTAVSVATANGVSGSSSGGATPALTISLGAITPTSVNSVVISGSSTPTLAVTGTTSVSGSNTGDQTNISGNAATVTNGMYTNANQTATGQNKFNNIIDVNNAVTVTSNAGTVPVTYRLNTFTNSSAATMAITMATTSAVDGQMTIVRIYDYSAVAQTIGWTNTENSSVSAPTTSNGSTSLPLTVGLQFNSQTTKWRVIAVA